MSILDNPRSIAWRKSSYSDSSHGDCVQIAELPWRKGRYSDSSGGNCLEVAGLSQVIAVRDSKEPAGTVLAFGRTAFRTFARDIRLGRYDL